MAENFELVNGTKLNLLPFLDLNLDLRDKKDGTSEIGMPPKGGMLSKPIHLIEIEESGILCVGEIPRSTKGTPKARLNKQTSHLWDFKENRQYSDKFGSTCNGSNHMICGRGLKFENGRKAKQTN